MFQSGRFPLIAMLAVAGAFAWRVSTLNNAGLAEPAWLRPSVLVALCLLAFVWFRQDSAVRRFPRSLWLNLGVLLAGFIVIPYYLNRSREGEDRAQVLGQFIAFIFALFAALIVGSLLGSFLG